MEHFLHGIRRIGCQRQGVEPQHDRYGSDGDDYRDVRLWRCDEDGLQEHPSDEADIAVDHRRRRRGDPEWRFRCIYLHTNVERRRDGSRGTDVEPFLHAVRGRRCGRQSDEFEQDGH